MSTEDLFSPIGKLVKSQSYEKVLSCILNKKGNRINIPYNLDLNHAWYLVGLSFYKLEDYSSALAAFNRSYKHWNEDVAAIRAIGNCFSELNKPRQARYYFAKALVVGGDEYKARDILLYNLGNAYFDLGDFTRAINYYRKVSETDRKSYKLAQKNIIHAEKKQKNEGLVKKYQRETGNNHVM